MFSKRERSIVFVDGSSIYWGLRKVGIWPSGLNYARLSRKLSGDHRDWLETRYYTGRVKQHPGSEERYSGQRRFLARLAAQGPINIRLGRIEKTGKKWSQKGVGILLATDLVSMAYEDRYDVAYLLSADGDLSHVVEQVRQVRDKKVIVAAPHQAHKIASAANIFIPLGREFFQGCWD